MSKIRAGATLPDFELPDENGDLHHLSELQGDDLMVLLLGRGEHCPRERQHQREMLRFYEWCSVAFTQLVTVLPNDLHDVYKLKISTGAHWTYLADTELEVQKALDIREYTDPIHDANVPHTLLLSPGLKIEKVYVGYWFWGRPSPYQLWQDLQQLSMRVKADFDPTTAAAKRAWKVRRRPGRCRRTAEAAGVDPGRTTPSATGGTRRGGGRFERQSAVAHDRRPNRRSGSRLRGFDSRRVPRA